jgi:inositol 1,4,5-triphosphate receptor type 1/inositol 1,4,5-triphosphate receptor type 3
MASEIDSKNQKITYGSIISISHLSDEDALIAGDGLTKRSVVLKGMSPYHRQ